tara:strand:+ start:519 stop:893 length:375 start_codon:yes stop_codon:yes gene_type:complete
MKLQDIIQRSAAINTKFTELRKAIRDFTEVQDKYARFGASDTEADLTFQVAIRDAWSNGKNTIESDPDFWELYTVGYDCTEAGNALAEAASKVIELVLSPVLKRSEVISRYLADYCWRIAWPAT